MTAFCWVTMCGRRLIYGGVKVCACVCVCVRVPRLFTIGWPTACQSGGVVMDLSSLPLHCPHQRAQGRTCTQLCAVHTLVRTRAPCCVAVAVAVGAADPPVTPEQLVHVHFQLTAGRLACMQRAGLACDPRTDVRMYIHTYVWNVV